MQSIIIFAIKYMYFCGISQYFDKKKSSKLKYFKIWFACLPAQNNIK